MATMSAADRAYRTRCRAVLTAGAAGTAVVGLVTTTADATTVGVLVTVLWFSAALALVNVGWWMTKPIMSGRSCPPPPTHLNGACALVAVLLALSTAATIVNAITGGPLL